MPAKKLESHDRRSYYIMVRFMAKHKAVIEAAAKASGCDDASDFVRRAVWPYIKPHLPPDDKGDHLAARPIW